MKRFTKITSLILSIILLITAFTACGGDVDNKSPLVGEWKSEGGIISLTFVFEKNGKGREEAYLDGEGSAESFTYEDKGTSVSIKFDGANAASERPYLIKGDCLIIADNFGGYLQYVRNGGELVDPTAEELKEIFGIEEEDIWDDSYLEGDDYVDTEWDEEWTEDFDDEEWTEDLGDEEYTDEGEDDFTHPLSFFYIDYYLDETAKMSNFMNFAYHLIDSNTFYGLVYNNEGYPQFVSAELSSNGTFVTAGENTLIQADTLPYYLTKSGDYIYYISGDDGAYRYPVDGGEAEQLIPEAYDYLQIVGDYIFFTDVNYNFYRTDLEGLNKELILDKTIYYAYMFTDEWLIYQDDADNESLHIYNIYEKVDVKITDTPSYSPIIYGTELYFPMVDENGLKTLAKTDLNNFSVDYDEVTGEEIYLYHIETTGNAAASYLAIDWDGYIYNGLDFAYPIDEYDIMENPDELLEASYSFVSEDYKVSLRYSEEGYVESVYVTLNETGGGRALPRFK